MEIKSNIEKRNEIYRICKEKENEGINPYQHYYCDITRALRQYTTFYPLDLRYTVDTLLDTLVNDCVALQIYKTYYFNPTFFYSQNPYEAVSKDLGYSKEMVEDIIEKIDNVIKKDFVNICLIEHGAMEYRHTQIKSKLLEWRASDVKFAGDLYKTMSLPYTEIFNSFERKLNNLCEDYCLETLFDLIVISDTELIRSINIGRFTLEYLMSSIKRYIENNFKVTRESLLIKLETITGIPDNIFDIYKDKEE